MTEPPNPAAILAVDVGALFVRAALFDVVDGNYRVISAVKALRRRNSQEAGESLAEAAWAAVHEIQEVSGVELLDGNGNLLPRRDALSGIDHRLCAVNGGPRIGVIGLTAELSMAAAVRAAREVGEVVGEVVLAEPVSSKSSSVTRQILTMLDTGRPDVLVLAGGTDGGSVAPLIWGADLLATLLQHVGSIRTVIFAGNQDAQSAVEDALGSAADFRVVANIRPSRDVENPAPLQQAIEAAWIDRVMVFDDGMRRLRAWMDAPVVSARRVFATALAKLSAHRGHPVFGVDAGASGIMVTAANRDLPRTYRSPCGLGLTGVDPRTLVRTVTAATNSALSHEEALDLLWNWRVRPWAVSDTVEPQVTGAVARALVREAIENAAARGVHAELARPGTIVGRGSVFEHVVPGEAARLLLDTVQPVGPCELAVDIQGTLTLAALADTVAPGLLTETADYDSVQVLGTAISASGSMPEGERIGQIRIELGDGRKEQRDLIAGRVDAVGIPLGQRATVYVEPSLRVDLGWGHGRQGKIEVTGGLAGLLIDLRGRPIATERQSRSARESDVAAASSAAEIVQLPSRLPARLAGSLGRLFGRVAASL